MRLPVAALVLTLAVASRGESQDRFNAIWGPNAGDVWAAGDDGGVAHFNGQGWQSMRTGTTNELRGIWASGPRDVWVVGDNGTIMRMTGTAWTYVRPPVLRHFIAVTGCGPNDVWVLGQSGDMGQPPALLHFDGSSWTNEPAPFAFRPAGLTTVCIAGSGGGGAGLTVAGTAYFDPTPAQRRDVGVLMRRSGGSWTTLGFDGRAMTDPQIGGAAWTSVATAAGSTLLAGQDPQGAVKLLLGRGSSWTSLPAPTVPEVDASDYRFTLAGDGTPIAVFENGLARYTAGRWVITSASTSTGQMSEADQARMMQLAQQISTAAQRGQSPTQAEMEEFQRLQTQMMSAQQAMVSSYGRAATLAFGSEAAVFAPSAANVFVASRNRSVMRVMGDSSEVVWSSICIMPQMATLEPCSAHAARGAVPAAATGPQPDAPPEAAPAAAPPAAPSAPRMPSRPRIPRP